MSRLVVAFCALVAAPIQCGHTSDASLREDETPGDALWELAGQFRDGHDTAGERRTLEYLVARYPASRWAPAAREEIAKLGGPAGDGGP